MVCQGIETLSDTGIAGFMSYPTTCDFQFYAKIMAALWLILVFTIFGTEKRRFGKSDAISAMGVSSLAIIFISIIGTLLGIIQPQVLIEIIVFGIIFITLWLLRK